MDLLFIARQQLLTATNLFFKDDDPVSVHTLAGAASELLSDLCERTVERPFHSDVLESNSSLDLVEYFAARNIYRNSFKHIGRNKDEIDRNEDARKRFSDIQNDFLLFSCVEDYLRLAKTAPIEFQALQLWFIAVHKDRVSQTILNSLSLGRWENLHNAERKKQKEAGYAIIQELKSNEDILNDPKTEK
ncbi:MAG: hypothetical protein AXW12_06835 [Thalassospira sp. Nap_22]|nr:MAG: hypothetical protein AXW12_06835 [Thalassospira sp. Nap_22]